MWESLKTKNASQLSERHFLEVPSDIYKWNGVERVEMYIIEY